jgi:hypothetical protein
MCSFRAIISTSPSDIGYAEFIHICRCPTSESFNSVSLMFFGQASKFDAPNLYFSRDAGVAEEETMRHDLEKETGAHPNGE